MPFTYFHIAVSAIFYAVDKAGDFGTIEELCHLLKKIYRK